MKPLATSAQSGCKDTYYSLNNKGIDKILEISFLETKNVEADVFNFDIFYSTNN